MFISVPWKPVVAIWLLLSGMALVGYAASMLMKRTTAVYAKPFAPRARAAQIGALAGEASS